MKLDYQTDPYALQAIQQIYLEPEEIQPFVAAGVLHGTFSVIANELGYQAALKSLDELKRQLKHWRDQNMINA